MLGIGSQNYLLCDTVINVISHGVRVIMFDDCVHLNFDLLSHKDELLTS